MCDFVQMRVRLCIFVHVCVHLCTCVRIFARVHAWAQLHTSSVHIHVRVHVCAYMYIHVRACACTCWQKKTPCEAVPGLWVCDTTEGATESWVSPRGPRCAWHCWQPRVRRGVTLLDVGWGTARTAPPAPHIPLGTSISPKGAAKEGCRAQSSPRLPHASHLLGWGHLRRGSLL